MTTDEEELFGQLDDVFEDVEELNLQMLPFEMLLDRFQELDQWLIDNEQVIRPNTQEARDVHSERNACQLEMRRRNIL